jgi:ABC-2 type transport system permease protein
VRRYGRIYLAFLRNCLARELEFRGHFFFQVISNTVSAVLSLALASIVFANVRLVAGWDLDRMILLTGTFLLVLSLINFLFHDNMLKLSELINRGDLDFVLTKPISGQFLVSTRYVTFSELPAILVAAFYILEGLRRTGARPGPADVLAYVVLVVSAVGCFYGLWFISVTFTLWSGRINNMAYLAMPVMDLARVPTDVYAGLFRPFFTFVVPLALIATLPSKPLLGLADPALVAYGPALATLLLAASNRFWHFSLRRYSSASS